MLALTNFLENAAAGALPLKPFERTFQGLIFTETNLRHSYPSSRSSDILNFPELPQKKAVKVLYSKNRHSSIFFLKFKETEGSVMNVLTQ